VRRAVSFQLSAVSRGCYQWSAMLCSLLFLTACGAPKAKTTFLESVDLINMTDHMAQSFAKDDVIGRRAATDPPWVISIERVTNHTNQLIPDREKWLYIGRLRAVLGEADFSKARSIVWVIPPERWPIIARELPDAKEPYGLRMKPTHLLTAEFAALTNTSGRGRSDAYLCDYQLIDLSTSKIEWEDKWEVKRAVSGKTYD
jgi:hypothetical protein